MFQVKSDHDAQMNSWCASFPNSDDCRAYQDSHKTSGSDSDSVKCEPLLVRQEQLTRDFEENQRKNAKADINYQESISNYQQYLKDWEQNFYELNRIINSGNPDKSYNQVFSQMKRNALKIKIAYGTHLEFIEEHHVIIDKFKDLRTAQIEVQEGLKKYNCDN